MEYEQFSTIYKALKSASANSSLNQDNVIEAIKSQLSPDSDAYKEWEKGKFSLDHVFITEGSFKASENTLLIRACSSTDLEVVDCLLRAGADVNVKIKEEQGVPLIIAIEKEYGDPKHKDLVDLLMKANADVNIGGEAGMTPIAKAVERGNFRVFKALREAGASLDIETPGGTLLKWAEDYQSDPEIINTLKAHEEKKQTDPKSTIPVVTEVKESVAGTSSETLPDETVLDNSSEGAEQNNVGTQGAAIDKKKEFHEKLIQAITSGTPTEVEEVFKNEDSDDIQQQLLTFNERTNERAIDYNPLKHAVYLASNAAKDKKN